MADLNGAPGAFDSFSVSIDNAIQLKVQDSLLLVVGRDQIEVHFEIFGEIVWNFDKPIVAVEILDDMLYVTNRLGSITDYTIQEDLTLSECAERDLTGTGWAMASFNSQLFVFTGNALGIFSGCLEMDTIVHLPLFVLDADIFQDTLYTIGPEGIAKYNLSSGLPEFIESGGLGGSQISANGGLIATTDGGSVHLYFENSQAVSDENNIFVPASVMLFDNYPEPFNASTTIQFELSSDSYVELVVYNLLGQKVTTLADDYYSSGRHSASWNGLGQNGLESASGVYFYRIRTNQGAVSRKMLLLK